MKGRLVSFLFAFAGHRHGQVVGDVVRALLVVFDHLWHRTFFTFSGVKSVVAGNVDIVAAFDAQVRISLDAAVGDLFQAGGRLGNIRALDAGCPDNRVGFDGGDLAVPLDFDFVRADSNHTRLEQDFDAHFFQAFLYLG